jgi:hypothetical protein
MRVWTGDSHVNALWSPVVYGRTLDVDFRFLALPDESEGSDVRWSEPYILASMKVAEQLPEQPRWLLTQTSEQRLVGVTCMARDLVGRDDQQIRDAHSRPLYLFVGYLTTTRAADGGFAAGPAYPTGEGGAPQQALAAFAPLYQYVRDHWDEQIPQPPSQGAASAFTFAEAGSASAVGDGAERALNTAPEWRACWPDGARERQALWAAAQGQAGVVSLCLGLARQRDALDSPFLNATVADVKAPVRERLAQTQPASQQAPTKAAAAPAHGRVVERSAAGADLPPVIAIRAIYDGRWLQDFVATLRQRQLYPTFGSQRKEAGSTFARFQQSGPDRLIYMFTRAHPSLLFDLDTDAAKTRMQQEGLMEPQVNPLDVRDLSGGSAAHNVADVIDFFTLPSRAQFTNPLDAVRDGFGGFVKGLSGQSKKEPRRDDF